MRLVTPSIKYKKQVLDYRNEFIETGGDLAGTSYLREYDVYEEWLKFVLDKFILFSIIYEENRRECSVR